MEGSTQTKRQHRAQIIKTLKRVPEGMESPECPEEVYHLWNMYHQIGNISPLTYTELKNWSELTAHPLAPYEAEMMIALDRIYWSTKHGR